MVDKEMKGDYEVIKGIIEGEKKQRSIYFIYSQITNNEHQIKFKVKDKKFKAFESNLKYNKKDIPNAQNTIFEISFNLEKDFLKFKLEMVTNDNKRFVSQKEYLIRKDKDLFIYNLEFKDYHERNWYTLYIYNKIDKAPEKKQLTMMEQFSIFSNYLNEKGLAKIEKGSTKETLVNDSISILTKKKDNFDFDLFLGLFREIYFYSSIKRLLTIFNIKKININKNIDPKLYEKILQVVLNKPILLLKNLDNNENLEKYFMMFQLYFLKILIKNF